MSVAIKVPAVGESISEGTIARWLKKDGDFVRQEEPVLELETDKATQPIPAPASGTLKISAEEGQTVQIGAVVGQIEPGPNPTTNAAKRTDKPANTSPSVEAPPAPSVKAAEPVLSPAARVLADTHHVDARALAGSARGGVVTKEDVQAHLEPKPALTAGTQVTTSARETRQRLSAIRQRIAEKLVASQKTTATLTTFNEADLSAVLDLRNRYKESFKEKHDAGLGFMPFFVKAAVEALKAFPLVNARIDGGDVVMQNYYNIGVAVSTEKGLMVPVLRDADRMSFAQIEKTLAGLANQARTGGIQVSDLQGGTFTITNGGIFGSLLSTPILNLPQCAILGMHTIQKRVVVVNDQMVIRPMMYLALSYDHRLIDGREAVLFLVRIKDCIENPERLLLEV